MVSIDLKKVPLRSPIVASHHPSQQPTALRLSKDITTLCMQHSFLSWQTQQSCAVLFCWKKRLDKKKQLEKDRIVDVFFFPTILNGNNFRLNHFLQEKTGLPKIFPHKNHLEFEQNSSGFFLESIFLQKSFRISRPIKSPENRPILWYVKTLHVSRTFHANRLPPTRVIGFFWKCCEVFRRFYLRLKKRNTQPTSRGRPFGQLFRHDLPNPFSAQQIGLFSVQTVGLLGTEKKQKLGLLPRNFSRKSWGLGNWKNPCEPPKKIVESLAFFGYFPDKKLRSHFCQAVHHTLGPWLKKTTGISWSFKTDYFPSSFGPPKNIPIE